MEHLSNAGTEPTEPQPERASDVSLGQLYDVSATWLGDNVPVYMFLHDRVNGETRTHEGQPLTQKDIVEQRLQIPGHLICEQIPEAATTLGIELKDMFTASYTPLMYMQGKDDPEPTLVTPFCSYDIKKADPKATRTHCYLETPPHSYLDWEGPKHNYFTEKDCQAFLAISQRLGDFHAELVRRGEYPEDLETYRQEEEIQRQVAANMKALEYQAIKAARDRLEQAPTIGPVGPETFDRLRYSEFIGNQKQTRTYTLVNSQDVDKLWAETAARLLECNTAIHVFSDELAARITPAFHDPRVAFTTQVVSASLKSESSEEGPVLTFTFGKEVVLRDGIKRYETDSFAVFKDAYIRLLTTRDALTGGPRTAQTNIENPINRAQYQVCHGLLAWVDPTSPIG